MQFIEGRTMMSEPKAAELLISYTIFDSMSPITAPLMSDVPWETFFERIASPLGYLNKKDCRLISMAQYGDQLSNKGCIRHADNVLRVFGAEIDYDGELMSMEMAAQKLQAASIRAALYTSPSHQTAKPRWRVLLPLSEPGLASSRRLFAARANQVLGGIATKESFALSQSFYIGKVKGSPYEAIQTTGRCIDQAVDIEPLFPRETGAANGQYYTDDELWHRFKNGTGRYEAMLKLSTRMALKGIDADDMESKFLAEFEGTNSRNADGIDLAERVRGICDSAAAKFQRSSITRQIAQEAEAKETGAVPATDLHACRLLYRRHGHNIHFTVERSWLVWDGARWKQDEKSVIIGALGKEAAESMYAEIVNATNDAERKELMKLAKQYQQRRSIDNAIHLARSEPNVLCSLTEFDADPWILNATNGIIQLQTGELLPHNKDKRCTLMTGTSYESDATCPRWQSFIGEICLEDVELMDYLQRMCGYLLTASVREQCLFFFHGGGSNGKTTLVETIMRAMGEYSCSCDTDILMVRKQGGIPNDIARLRGVRAAFMNETNQGHRFDEAKLKNLTGGDTLTARFMREEFFDFRPTHKLILRGNHKPTVNGTDEGIWRRLRLIPFDLRLTADEKDVGLEDTLKGELPGILRWMVDGCRMWQREGLKTPVKVLEAIKEYRDQSDTLGRFIEENCEVSRLAEHRVGSFHSAYQEFCKSAGERWASLKDFPEEMARRGYPRRKLGGTSLFVGIKLKDQGFDRYTRSED